MPYSDCLLYNFVTEISQSALMFTPASENNSTFSLNDPVFTLKTEKASQDRLKTINISLKMSKVQ